VAPYLSIVIPVFNEEDGIADMLKDTMSTLDERESDWEILVVDNASSDETRARVEPFLADERIRLLRNPTNRGKGYSVRRGMLEARGDRRLMCDADCARSLASLPDLIQALDHADVVAGSRLAARGASVDRNQPWRRRLVGMGFLGLTRIVLGPLVGDVFCGFKLWTAEAAEAVFERVELDGWVFDAEALALAKRLGYRLTEVGIDWSDRPESRFAIRGSVLLVIGELNTARRDVRRVPRRSGRPA
jgi:dolichyl-phosphate beta-glucosyltransferase